MDSNVIVMIVTLALPNGGSSYSVKPMTDAAACQVEAQIEASDPFVAGVECSELSNGELKLTIKPGIMKPVREISKIRSTG